MDFGESAEMDEHLESNRKLWNEKVNIHYRSDYYDVEGFKAGEESLYPIEVEELAGEVAGKTLLHLQCHFGMDTMSWRGAGRWRRGWISQRRRSSRRGR